MNDESNPFKESITLVELQDIATQMIEDFGNEPLIDLVMNQFMFAVIERVLSRQSD